MRSNWHKLVENIFLFSSLRSTRMWRLKKNAKNNIKWFSHSIFLINALYFLSCSEKITHKSFTKGQKLECIYQKREGENHYPKILSCKFWFYIKCILRNNYKLECAKFRNHFQGCLKFLIINPHAIPLQNLFSTLSSKHFYIFRL